MRPPATRFVVFNAAAALIGVAAVVAAARSVLISPSAAPCTERYLNVTHFALEQGGAALVAADLQASLHGRDVGVIENVTINPIQSGPQRLAMSVALRSAQPAQQAGPRGVSFPWEPHVLRGKASACLSFHVMLSPDFDFTRGGALPGLAGGEDTENGDKFLARLAWRPKGKGGATVRVTEKGMTRALPAEGEPFDLPRGKWAKLEQEVVLNAPGKGDGVLRVWLDGALVIDRTDMIYRTKSDATISGASMDVFYGSGPDDVAAAPPKSARLSLTTIEVRWP